MGQFKLDKVDQAKSESIDHCNRILHQSPDNMGRSFYEDLIAKAILFKGFEQLYGSGPNAIGQIRSSVVPYALSLLYLLTLDKKSSRFDLGAIWAAQGLPDDLKEFSKNMLSNVHDWCKLYSKSDDVGEYAKKEELWKSIIGSAEFTAFRNAESTKAIVQKYLLSEADYKKRYSPVKQFDFTLITENCRIFSNGADFYSKLRMKFFDQLSDNEMRKLSELSQKLQVKYNIPDDLVEFEIRLLGKLESQDPDWFLAESESTGNMLEVLNGIINIYNKNVSRIKEAFEAEQIKMLKKGMQDNVANAYKNIGLHLFRAETPLIADIIKISSFSFPNSK